MRKYILALATAWLTSAGAMAGGLDDLLHSVVANNPALRVSREEMRAAGYELEEGNTLDATSVEYSPFFRSGAGGVASSELIVSQEFDFPTLYAGRGKSIKLGKESLEKEYGMKVAECLSEVTGLYLNLVYLDKKGKTLSSRLASLRKMEELAGKRLEERDATALDLNRVKLQRMQIETELAALDAEQTSVENELTLLNGNLWVEVEREYPAWALPEGGVKAMVAGDAAVARSEAEVALANQEESLARQSWLPKLTVGYRRNTETDEALNGFVVGASFPLFSAGKRVKSAKARKAAARIAAEAEAARAEKEMENAFKELDMARRSLQTFDLPLIAETRRLLDISLEARQITLADYLAETTVLDEQLTTYDELEYEYYRKMSVVYRNNLMK